MRLAAARRLLSISSDFISAQESSESVYRRSPWFSKPEAGGEIPRLTPRSLFLRPRPSPPLPPSQPRDKKRTRFPHPRPSRNHLTESTLPFPPAEPFRYIAPAPHHVPALGILDLPSRRPSYYDDLLQTTRAPPTRRLHQQEPAPLLLEPLAPVHQQQEEVTTAAAVWYGTPAAAECYTQEFWGMFGSSIIVSGLKNRTASTSSLPRRIVDCIEVVLLGYELSPGLLAPEGPLQLKLTIGASTGILRLAKEAQDDRPSYAIKVDEAWQERPLDLRADLHWTTDSNTSYYATTPRAFDLKPLVDFVRHSAMVCFPFSVMNSLELRSIGTYGATIATVHIEVSLHGPEDFENEEESSVDLDPAGSGPQSVRDVDPLSIACSKVADVLLEKFRVIKGTRWPKQVYVRLSIGSFEGETFLTESKNGDGSYALDTVLEFPIPDALERPVVRAIVIDPESSDPVVVRGRVKLPKKLISNRGFTILMCPQQTEEYALDLRIAWVDKQEWLMSATSVPRLSRALSISQVSTTTLKLTGGSSSSGNDGGKTPLKENAGRVISSPFPNTERVPGALPAASCYLIGFAPSPPCSPTTRVQIVIWCGGQFYQSPILADQHPFNEFGRSIVEYRCTEELIFEFAAVVDPTITFDVWMRGECDTEATLYGTASVCATEVFSIATLHVYGGSQGQRPVGTLSVGVGLEYPGV